MVIKVSLRPDDKTRSYFEVLGCNRSSSKETITKAYRDLSRKYHPDANLDDPLAAMMFQRVGEAYAALCDPCIALVGKGASGISPPLSPGLAREVYRQTFGEYRKKNYSEGAVIGLPFSYELRDALERSKGTRENLSFGFWKYRVHFFRTWFIKLELSLTIQLCETMATWIAISLCIASFFQDENQNLGIYIDIFGGLSVLFAQFISHFWYGFTRYPTFMDKNYIAWLKGDALLIDPDLEDIRGVCSFYCHGDSLHRSQLLAVVTSIPWLLIDHTIAFGVSFLYFLFSSCKKHICRRHFDTQCINNAMYTGQIIKNIAALISIIFYYVSWILGANLVKAIITVGIVANQNLYQAILFRKGYADFLTSFAFGNVIAITTVEGVKKEFETDSESDSDSDSDEETATVRAQNLVLESDQSPEIVSELKQTAWESEHDSSLGNEGNSFDPGILHWIRGLVKEDDTRSMIGDITSSFFRSNTESKSGVEKGVEKKRKRMNHRGIEVDDDNDDSVLKGIGENKEQEASSFDEAIEDEGAIPVEDSEDIEAGIEVDFDTFQRPEPENTKPSSVISAFKSIKRRIENEFFSGRKLLYSANQKSADKKTECTPNNQLANDNNPIVPVDKHSAVAIDTTDTFGDATDDASLTLVLDGIHHFSRSISTESTQGRDKTDMSTEDFIIQHFSTMSPTMRSTSFFQQPSKDSHSGSLSLSASATNSPTKKVMAFFHNPINDDSLVSLPDGRGDNKNSPTDRFIIHPDGSIHPIPEPSIEDLLVEQSIGDHHSLGDREDTESYTGGEKASIMDQSHIVTVEASLASSLEKNKSNGSPCNNRKVEEIHQNLSLKDLEKGLQLDFIPEAVKSNLSIGSTLDDNDAFAIATNRDEAGLVSTRRCDQFIF